MITPFSIQIAQETLDDLKARLKNTKWPDEIEGSKWEYGTNLTYIKELTDYWANTFNWRVVENEINAYPNFIANIDGYKIHFLHIKGKGNKSIPLLISHGWPGSFIEMIKLIPLLTSDPDFSFDVVIPSVIGFGFSDKITHKGANSEFVADIWHKLMLELGYPKYGAQGGDIGSGISTWLALKHPNAIIGLHLNYISGSYRPYLKEGELLSEEALEFIKNATDWYAAEGGYSHMHATKPLTLAYGLTDSPVGLCAWILEKFNSWSDHNETIENVFTKQELLANITLYWCTQTIHSSIRIYNENRKNPHIFKKDDFVQVPVGYAKFPKEISTPPRSYIEKGFNIQHWTEMNVGGHFAAMEQPSLLAADITAFFKTIAI